MRALAEAIGWGVTGYAIVSTLIEGYGLIPMMVECAGRCGWGQ